MPIVLGLNVDHANSAAALLIDGAIVHAVEEERLNRIKYWSGWPSRAIESCLTSAGLKPQDVEHIAVSRDPRANLAHKAAWALLHPPSPAFIRARTEVAVKAGQVKRRFADQFGVAESALPARVHHVEHHVAHLASAYFPSGYDEAAGVSVDGFGDFVSATIARCRGDEIEILRRVFFPHSLGIFYTALTQFLGFTRYGDEYKVMGLAAYGQPRYVTELRRVLRTGDIFELDLRYFRHQTSRDFMTWRDVQPTLPKLYSDEIEALLGPTIKSDELMARGADVARSMQEVFEEAMVAMLHRTAEMLPSHRLCLAGGVALNSLFNGRIRRVSRFRDVYIQPAAHDAGTALGGAQYVEHSILGGKRRAELRSSYLGPEYDEGRHQQALDAAGVAFERREDAALADEVASQIAEGKIVGWYQGRMEWGPRALGNRSILADPRRRDMREILNTRIKLREPFRPFAPSVALEATGDYFTDDYPEPFMVKVYDVRPDKRELIPAVTHVDGTARVQTVARDANPRYWQLLRSFGALTGVPMLLNTSFNENEPIVCTPEEAIDTFVRTKMDTLVVGNNIATRRS